MFGSGGKGGADRCFQMPQVKTVSQLVHEALQSRRYPCRERAGKYWRREQQVDGMKVGGGGAGEGGLPQQSGDKPFTAGKGWRTGRERHT